MSNRMLLAFPICKRACTYRGQTAEQLQRRRAWASFATGHFTYLHTYIHTYTYIYLFPRRDTAGLRGGCWAWL
jgi:hypothetical protein